MYANFDNNGNLIAYAQHAPEPLGTWQTIADDDARIQAFIDKFALLQEAKTLLRSSDATLHRVSEAISLGLTTTTAADVVAWMNYRRALRNVVNGTSTTLPTKPAYPAGT